MTLVGDDKLVLPLFSGQKIAQEQAARFDIEFGSLRLNYRQGVEKRGEGDVSIVIGHGFLGGFRQVCPSNAAKILLEDSLAQKIARRRPFIPASLGEVVESPTRAPGRKYEFLTQSMKRTILMRSQFRSIEIAKRRYLGIGTPAPRTVKHGHKDFFK